METIVKLSADGQVKLSSSLRRLLDLESGDDLYVQVVGKSLVLTPQKALDRDQSFFWSAEWQAAERAAQADIESGRIVTFESVDDLIRDLSD